MEISGRHFVFGDWLLASGFFGQDDVDSLGGSII